MCDESRERVHKIVYWQEYLLLRYERSCDSWWNSWKTVYFLACGNVWWTVMENLSYFKICSLRKIDLRNANRGAVKKAFYLVF